MNLKIIIFSIFVAFIISFAILIIFLNYFHDTLAVRENTFYGQHFDPSLQKIFILGSSHVGELNNTDIDKKLSKIKVNYSVYNLAISADTPTMRLDSIDQIIEAKPKIVLYGIEYRMFENQVENIDLQDKTLQNSYHFFAKLVEVKDPPHYNWDIFRNPKLVTLTALQDFLGVNEDCTIWCYEKNMPFYSHTIPERNKIISYYSLPCKDCKIDSNIIDSIQINPNVQSLEKIITILQKHDIKVIILITPHSRYFLSHTNESQKNVFHSILYYLHQKTGVKIFSLEDKYADLNIWSDQTHVAFVKEVSVYTDDVTKIIINETES